ncbi:MAG: glutathione S-transferase family protein [Caulobacterales bacterium]|nr:glutathione S-transferase family protein [Caulobacterales bacterium]
MKIIGSYVSPYVRKVLAGLNLKGLSYEIDPITPFFGDDAFEKASPLRRIPVLVDGDLTLCDSSVICAYLDEAYPARPLLPADPKDRARARWLEEYADTRMGDVFIWGLFYQRFVRPAVWKEPTDEARVQKSLTQDAPAVLDYLESQAPADGFLFGEIGLADISVATFFVNAGYVDFAIDRDRWPRAAAWVGRVLEHECVRPLLALEKIQVSTSIAGRRQALLDAGAPLCPETLAGREPRPSIMLA